VSGARARIARVGVVANAKARGHEALAAALDAWRSAGVDVVVRDDPSDDSAGDATRKLIEGGAAVDAVLAAGGDGTAHDVAGALVALGENAPPMILAPLGTGNDFARTLALDADAPLAHLDDLDALRLERIDVARVNGEALLLNALSIGAGVRATRDADEGLKRSLGPLAYVLRGVRELATLEPVVLEVTCDGTQRFDGRAWAAFVANGRYTGGGFVVAPDASLTDGMLDVVIASELTAGELLSSESEADLAEKRFDHASFERFSASAMHIRIIGQVAVNIDGEPFDEELLSVEVLRGALGVLR